MSDSRDSEENDILICGKCRNQFSSLPDFVQHKRLIPCKTNSSTINGGTEPNENINISTEAEHSLANLNIYPNAGGVSELISHKSSEEGSNLGSNPGSKPVYRCPQDGCLYTSFYPKDVRRHHRIHTGEKPFACGTCGTSFSREDKLKIHERIHAGHRPYQCGICNYSSVSSGNLRKHMKSHTEERPFQCQLCPYAAKSQSQITTHLRTHTGDAPFPCPCAPCSRAFKTRSDLKRHIRLHTGEKPFLCHLCDYRCAVASNLKSHIRLTHGSSGKQHSCDSCSYSSASAKSLLRHKKLSHEGITSCDVCDFAAAGKQLLQQHVREKHTTKPYLCKYCQQAFMQMHILRSHVRKDHELGSCDPQSNSGEPSGSRAKMKTLPVRTVKPYACTQCRMRFVRQDSLTRHVRAHNDLPPQNYQPIGQRGHRTSRKRNAGESVETANVNYAPSCLIESSGNYGNAADFQIYNMPCNAGVMQE